MNRRDAWAQWLVGRIRPADLERFAKVILDAVDEASAKRWEAASARAASLPGVLRPDKLRALSDRFTRELGGLGAGVGAIAAAPLIGTGTSLLAATGELFWFTTRAGDMVLTVAALHGMPEPSVDERRAWMLALLLYGASARDGLAAAFNGVAAGQRMPSASKVPIATLQAANRVLSGQIVRRYGTRRGAVALGSALPLGLGALIGGGVNAVAMRHLARDADAFFARLPYSAIDTTAIEVAGRLGPAT